MLRAAGLQGQKAGGGGEAEGVERVVAKVVSGEGGTWPLGPTATAVALLGASSTLLQSTPSSCAARTTADQQRGARFFSPSR